MCVQITTGTGARDDGDIAVNINGSVAARSYHAAGSIVIQSCIKGLQTLTIQGTSNDDWAGNIVITVDGDPTTVICQNCSGDFYTRAIVVDGNSDSSGQAPTRCFVEACSITWVAAGTKNLNFYDVSVTEQN